MNEIWKPIKGYEGLYEVSNFGRVKSLNYKRTHTECIMKNQIDKEGYHTIILSKFGKVKGFKISRLVYEAFIGLIPDGFQINHIDENKNNNSISNLNLMTPKQNANHGTRNQRVKDKTTNSLKMSKPIKCTENGTVFPSIGEMLRHFGKPRTVNVKRSIENGWKCYGYHWEYINNDKSIN